MFPDATLNAERELTTRAVKPVYAVLLFWLEESLHAGCESKATAARHL